MPWRPSSIRQVHRPRHTRNRRPPPRSIARCRTSTSAVRLVLTVRSPQDEPGFRASQGLLREIAEGMGQPITAAAPLTAETIIGSLAVGQTEGTVTIMFTDVEESPRLL